MTLNCGISLHASNIVVSIVNENDIVVFEKWLPNEINGIVYALKLLVRSFCLRGGA